MGLRHRVVRVGSQNCVSQTPKIRVPKSCADRAHPSMDPVSEVGYENRSLPAGSPGAFSSDRILQRVRASTSAGIHPVEGPLDGGSEVSALRSSQGGGPVRGLSSPVKGGEASEIAAGSLHRLPHQAGYPAGDDRPAGGIP